MHTGDSECVLGNCGPQKHEGNYCTGWDENSRWNEADWLTTIFRCLRARLPESTLHSDLRARSEAARVEGGIEIDNIGRRSLDAGVKDLKVVSAPEYVFLSGHRIGTIVTEGVTGAPGCFAVAVSTLRRPVLAETSQTFQHISADMHRGISCQ